MGLFKKEQHVDTSEEKVDLEAPSSLPDSLIDQYGLNDNTKVKSEEVVHPQKIPVDLVREKELLEKIHDDSSKIEYLSNDSDDVFEEDVGQVNKNIVEDVKWEINSSKSDNSVVVKPSFFESLERKLKNNNQGLEDHLSEGLVDMMKKYHSARSRGEHFFFHEQDLEDELYRKMLTLKEIEAEWVIRAKEFNIAKELLQEKEDEIEKISDELRVLIRNADKFKVFNKNTTHDNAFKLSNGKILLSINDLLHELRIMGDDVFFHHVSSSRNDFALWVLHIFGQKKLFNLLNSCKSKDALIDVLEKY